MRAVLQRVSSASVSVYDDVAATHVLQGRIGPGLLVLLGIGKTDSPESARSMADKIVRMRIFGDSVGRMNLDLQAAGGSLLIVSQFTLYADSSRGRRPGFDLAADPVLGRTLYDLVISILREAGHHVVTGVFGATMQLHVVHEGPVTILLETDNH